MTLAAALSLLVAQVQGLTQVQGETLRRLREVEAAMATRAELNAGLTQMETALRAAVATIGQAVAEITARVEAQEIDLQPELDRVNAATQTLAQLAEAVQQAAVPPPAA